MRKNPEPKVAQIAGHALYDCMACEKAFWRAGDALKAKCPRCGKMVQAMRRNPGSICAMKGCRDTVVPGEQKCDRHMTEYDEAARHQRLTAERRIRAAEQAARRPNPSSYAGDPYWTRARFKGECCKCHGVVRKGDPIYYYPKGKRVYCDGASCGKAANQDFISMRDDEDMYNRRNPSGFMWGLMPEAATGEALASLYGRNRAAKSKDSTKRSRPRSIQRKSSRRSIRRNPGVWVTEKGDKVKAGDTIEYVYKSGPSAPVVRRKKVIKYLVFDDHVMVQSGNNGDYVDDRNFIRVVRRA